MRNPPDLDAGSLRRVTWVFNRKTDSREARVTSYLVVQLDFDPGTACQTKTPNPSIMATSTFFPLCLRARLRQKRKRKAVFEAIKVLLDVRPRIARVEAQQKSIRVEEAEDTKKKRPTRRGKRAMKEELGTSLAEVKTPKKKRRVREFVKLMRRAKKFSCTIGDSGDWVLVEKRPTTTYYWRPLGEIMRGIQKEFIYQRCKSCGEWCRVYDFGEWAWQPGTPGNSAVHLGHLNCEKETCDRFMERIAVNELDQ